ncbi:MAG: hypothetical protein V4622_13845 [Bacteroidota bacterium]
MKIKLLSSILVLFLFVLSCKKDSTSVDFHEDYFPLEKGKFVEYNATYIFHDHVAGIHETTNFILKTVVGDTTIDNSGRIAWKFERYVFDHVFQIYEFKDLWTAIIDQSRAELVEENQRIIKLVFAPTLEKEWDINAFNSEDELLAYYENIHKPTKINGLNFDSTITVVQEKIDPNLVEYRRKIEIYAKNVGLIHKYYKDLTIKNFDTLQPQKGTELYYNIINYGTQ